MIYLDYNATAPTKPAVILAVTEILRSHGNPSSVHGAGRAARKQVEQARLSLADLIKVKPAQVVFTSGGTESNNMVLNQPTYRAVAVSMAEHDSVLAARADHVPLPVLPNGLIDLAAYDATLQKLPALSLVSVMLVNNETGVIQPVAELAAIAHRYGHHFHTDAIQAAGRLDVDFTKLGVDYLTLSAHKIGGPQGVGAVIVRENAQVVPFIKGGGQEMNRRAGTENVAGICGFGVAARLAADDLVRGQQLGAWRDDLQQRLLAVTDNKAIVIGAEAPRVANTLNIALPGVSSETQVMALDLAGIAASAGSACSSGKVKVSYVVKAMGYADDIAGSTLRLSLGWSSQSSDVDRCVDAYKTLYGRIRARSSSHAAA